MLQTQQGPDHEEGNHGDQHGRQVGAAAQCLQQGALVGIFLRADEKRTDDGADNAHGRHSHGNSHGLERLVGKRSNAQRRSGDNGTDIGLIQVRAHTGHVAHIVAHIIRDNSRVTGVILGDAGFHLAHQVGAHIGRLGEYAAAHTGKQRHGGGAHTEGQHGAGNIGRFQMEHEAQQGKPNRNIKQAQTHYREAHDAAGREGHTQAAIQSLLAGVGRAAVGGRGDLHAHKAAQTGEKAAGQKGERHKPGQQLAGCHHAQHHNHTGEKHTHHGVLAFQIGVGTLANGPGDFLHQGGSFRKLQHTLGGDHDECQRNDRTDKRGQYQIDFHTVSSLFFFQNISFFTE